MLSFARKVPFLHVTSQVESKTYFTLCCIVAHILFIDGSGSDHRDSPYSVLAGISIEDRDLWNLITELQKEEDKQFGLRYSKDKREIHAKQMLKRKVFRLAAQMDEIPLSERRELARSCFLDGEKAGKKEITALAQSKLIFIRESLKIAAKYRCRVFASVVAKNSPEPSKNMLRKDYAYLFERFFYFLEDSELRGYGIVVFDELEKSQSHILINQMSHYFGETTKGQFRSSKIIPEPFFVHSHLTTGIQLADIIAYLISWGVRFKPEMTEPKRDELTEFAELIFPMRYRATRDIEGNPDFEIWSLAWISDLRPRTDCE